MPGFFQRYLLPGFVYQGIVIAGGYATGRELVEFFLPSGPVGGLLGMAVAASVWSLVMAISFELCRLYQTYDYNTFFQRLLGRWWFLYEVLFFLMMILTLAVIGAAAGEIAQGMVSVNPIFGTLVLLGTIGFLTFKGNKIIERFMGTWSLLLYLIYFILVVWCFSAFGDNIKSSFAAAQFSGSWFWNGIRYAGYNVAAVPAVFFCLRHIRYRREAIGSGLLAGIIAMAPGVFLYVALMADYPNISSATIPSAVLLGQLDAPWFSVLFQIVLLGTFVQTGLGLVHALNERVATTLAARGQHMPDVFRPAIALGLLSVALTLAASVGIIRLIANGYGLMTYGFIAVFVVPVMTIGVVQVLRASSGGIQNQFRPDVS